MVTADVVQIKGVQVKSWEVMKVIKFMKVKRSAKLSPPLQGVNCYFDESSRWAFWKTCHNLEIIICRHNFRDYNYFIYYFA